MAREEITFSEGDRVIMHDAAPPYDFKEATVTDMRRLVAGAEVYQLRLDDGSLIYPDPQRIHRWPLPSGDLCVWCNRRMRMATGEYPV
jgi:hypothetical protein